MLMCASALSAGPYSYCRLIRAFLWRWRRSLFAARGLGVRFTTAPRTRGISMASWRRTAPDSTGQRAGGVAESSGTVRVPVTEKRRLQ